MERFILNILLALVWVFLRSSQAGVADMLVGFVLGYLVLGLLAPLFPATSYFEVVRRGFRFLLFFVKSLLVANFQIAWELVTPGWSMRPAFVACELGPITPGQAVVVSAVVTLLPGTLGVDLTADGRILYIHAMYAAEPDAVREEVREIVRHLYGEVV